MPQTTPRTEAGKRLLARAPKANMAAVLAYEASDRAKVDMWLAFEADYHNHLAGTAAGLS